MQIQLLLTKTEDSLVLHAIDEDLRIATLEWDYESGEVLAIEVVESFRRRGVATALWQRAQALHAQEPMTFPAPVHSVERSADGDAWARSVGGHLPSLARAEDFGLSAQQLADLRR